MGIYVLTLFLVLFLWIVISKVKFTMKGQEKLKNKSKVYAIFIGTWLFCVAVLRNYTVGADTMTYLSRYVRLVAAEWKDIFRLANLMMFEPGYAIYNKLLGYISTNPRILLVTIAFVIVFLFSLYIYKESKMPWLSFFMFISMGMFGESLSLIRQYVAVALILISYHAIKNNKLIEFVATVLLAATFHTSALIILPMFWISKIKWNKLHFCLILGAAAFTFYIVKLPEFRFSDSLISFLARHTTYARYFTRLSYGSSGGAVGLLIIYFSFLFFIILRLYRSDMEERNMYIAFAMAAATLTIFSFITGISERLLPYFASMFIFSIPATIMNEQKGRIRIQYTSIICTALTIYYIAIICRADSFQVIPYEIWDNTMKWF